MWVYEPAQVPHRLSINLVRLREAVARVDALQACLPRALMRHVHIWLLHAANRLFEVDDAHASRALAFRLGLDDGQLRLGADTAVANFLHVAGRVEGRLRLLVARRRLVQELLLVSDHGLFILTLPRSASHIQLKLANGSDDLVIRRWSRLRARTARITALGSVGRRGAGD